MADFELAGTRVAPAAHGFVQLPVCTMASGHELKVAVHVLHGSAPGPVVLVAAGSHGEEVFSTELLRQAHGRLVGESIKGTVLIMPQFNPPSFEWGVRHTPNDGFNLNRVFPGNPGGWVTERIASVIAEQLVPRLDLLIDYHGGASDTEINYTYTKPLTSEYGRRVHELALLCEAEVLWEREVSAPGSLSVYAEQQGVLSVVPEVGGGPSFGTKWIEQGLRGLWNLLKAAGVLTGQPEVTVKPRQLVREAHSLRPAHGGLFIPGEAASEVGKRVQKGALLGKVVSPYSFQELDVIRAPVSGDLMISRTRTSKVHAGDYGFTLGDPSSGYAL